MSNDEKENDIFRQKKYDGTDGRKYLVQILFSNFPLETVLADTL